MREDGGLEALLFCRFTPGKELLSSVEEAEWVAGVDLDSMENLAPYRIKSLDCPANSDSL
jgi:hypothetical protein